MGIFGRNEKNVELKFEDEKVENLDIYGDIYSMSVLVTQNKLMSFKKALDNLKQNNPDNVTISSIESIVMDHLDITEFNLSLWLITHSNNLSVCSLSNDYIKQLQYNWLLDMAQEKAEWEYFDISRKSNTFDPSSGSEMLKRMVEIAEKENAFNEWKVEVMLPNNNWKLGDDFAFNIIFNGTFIYKAYYSAFGNIKPLECNFSVKELLKRHIPFKRDVSSLQDRALNNEIASYISIPEGLFDKGFELIIERETNKWFTTHSKALFFGCSGNFWYALYNEDDVQSFKNEAPEGIFFEKIECAKKRYMRTILDSIHNIYFNVAYSGIQKW